MPGNQNTTIEDGHIVKSFDGDMRELHGYVLEMGTLVIKQIDRTLQALKNEDAEAARDVIEKDRELNELDVTVDRHIVNLLARRQPVAKDLRAVMTISKMMNDLERVGDQTRKVALLVERIYGGENQLPNASILSDIPYIAEFASDMVRDSLVAFDRLDIEQSLAVIERDVQLEGEFQDALRRLATYIMQDSRNIGFAVDTVLGLRALERIGGHAKNIAGYVIYLCTGKDVRHLDLPTLARELRG